MKILVRSLTRVFTIFSLSYSISLLTDFCCRWHFRGAPRWRSTSSSAWQSEEFRYQSWVSQTETSLEVRSVYCEPDTNCTGQQRAAKIWWEIQIFKQRRIAENWVMKFTVLNVRTLWIYLPWPWCPDQDKTLPMCFESGVSGADSESEHLD